MRYETLEQWLEWQGSLHPQEIELGLKRVSGVWRKLTPLPPRCKVITVGGTNGKGSCATFLEAILRAASYRVGCYTSPHLVRYNERVVVDGRPVSDRSLCDAFERVDQARGETSLTYFEFGTLAALDIFAHADLDVVILEVGLGGRLDAVNIVDPDVALITTVDIDHSDWLGDDREQIGREKAGIMRPGRPAVYAGDDIPQSVRQTADELGAQLHVAGEEFGWRHQDQGWSWLHPQHPRHSLPLPAMRGDSQLQNAAAVLMALECLRDELPLDQRAIRFGLQEAKLAGRFQILAQDPLVVIDVAHNPQAARTLAASLGDIFCHGETRAVFSMLADKDIRQVVEIMAPRVDQWYLFPIHEPRAASIEQLQTALRGVGVGESAIRSFEGLEQAYAAAQADAEKEDRLVAFGSFYVVGDLLAAQSHE